MRERLDWFDPSRAVRFASRAVNVRGRKAWLLFIRISDLAQNPKSIYAVGHERAGTRKYDPEISCRRPTPGNLTNLWKVNTVSVFHYREISKDLQSMLKNLTFKCSLNCNPAQRVKWSRYYSGGDS